MKTRSVDIAVVGAGTAGLSAYREARKYTDRIALIEGGPFGTMCARVGCMPSKLLIAPAEARHRLSHLAQFGISIGASEVDGAAVMRRVRSERDRFAGFVVESMEGFDQRHIVRACARFEDAHTLALSPAQVADSPALTEPHLVAARIVIAAGSRPRIPEILKAAGDRVIVNDDLFDMQALPASVAVFGAGAIGLELGQALHRLGVVVRVFGRGGRMGGISDPGVRHYAARVMGAEMPLSLDARDVVVSREGDSVVVRFVDDDGRAKTERYDWLLAATGRQSNVDRLDIENSGLALDTRGIPLFDAQTMRAGDSHVFLAGDVAADRALQHEAAYEGRVAGRNAAHYPEVYRNTRRTPLAIVFTDPQIASVGSNHEQLTAANQHFAVGEVSFENQGRSSVLLVNQGLLRGYGEFGTGLLLGAEMIGAANEHLAHLLAWVIQMRMSVDEVLELPFYHPVIEEGLRTALRELQRALGMGPKPPANCLDCGPGG